MLAFITLISTAVSLFFGQGINKNMRSHYMFILLIFRFHKAAYTESAIFFVSSFLLFAALLIKRCHYISVLILIFKSAKLDFIIIHVEDKNSSSWRQRGEEYLKIN
jgi:hypothetical protein